MTTRNEFEQRLEAFEQKLQSFDWFTPMRDGYSYTAVCEHPMLAILQERETLGNDGRKLYDSYCPF